MEITFNTHNPDQLIYQTEELQLTILGGVKLEGLDRMRVTIKAEIHNRKFKHYINNPDIADLAIRHNIDLYNDTQVEKLIRKTADRLEIGSSQIAKAIADLTSQLEVYRLAEMEKRSTRKETRKPLTEVQREEAMNYLSAPGLMQRTGEDIGNSGVIGEEYNRLLMYIIFTSRKTEKPLHIISLGESGTGKSHLQEKVAELIPEEEKEEITSLSENAFYYFEQTELKNKLILIEDLDGAITALFPLRELQSKRRITKRISIKDSKGQTRSIRITVEGPVSVAGCTTHESLYEDNANRCFLIYLDESKEQDERIMQYQRAMSAGSTDHRAERKIKELMKNIQRVLQPITVRNPYAQYLKIPAEVFKPRRTNAHYLAFIEAVTFYHQYQREQKADEESGEIYIETTIEDIEQANKLMKEVLLRKSDELNKSCRSYFEYLKVYLKTENKTAFTSKEVRKELRVNHSNQKRYMLMLLQNNLIRKAQGTKAKGYGYEIVSYEEYESLKSSISIVLDNILNEIKSLSPVEEARRRENSSQMVHSQNEPLKPKASKAKRGKVQKFTEKDNSTEKKK